jgi:hypothetical protein
MGGNPAMSPVLKGAVLCMMASLSVAACFGGSELVGTSHTVSSTGQVDIAGEHFDLRPHNNCGHGALYYPATVVSASGRVRALFRINCSFGFNMGTVVVLEWGST